MLFRTQIYRRFFKQRVADLPDSKTSKVASMVGIVRFDVTKHVLDIVYTQVRLVNGIDYHEHKHAPYLGHLLASSILCTIHTLAHHCQTVLTVPLSHVLHQSGKKENEPLAC